MHDKFEDLSPEAFDISDVSYTWGTSKSGREVTLVMRASSNRFNLLKTFLALEAHLEEIKREIGIMEQAPESQ